jgi:hypothetical protein
VGSGAYGEIGGHAMQTTDDTSRTGPSKLANLPDAPLAELSAMNMVPLEKVLGRLIADPQAVATPGAVFQSVI